METTIKNLLFLDTETTDKDETGRLVQLAFKQTDEKCSVYMFKPPTPISFEAMAVHHITNEMVENLDTLENIKGLAGCFQALLDDNVMVAHNAKFDAEILRREGLEPKRIIDTLKVARTLLPGLPQYKLQYLRYRYGLVLDEEVTAHDAKGDVLVLEKFFWVLFGTMMAFTPMGNVEVLPEKPEADDIMATQEEIEKATLGARQKMVIERMIEITANPVLLETIAFGKHKDKTFAEIKKLDRKYLEWLSAQPDLDEDLAFTLNHHLAA